MVSGLFIRRKFLESWFIPIAITFLGFHCCQNMFTCWVLWISKQRHSFLIKILTQKLQIFVFFDSICVSAGTVALVIDLI